MENSKYLDEQGLELLWQRIVALINKSAPVISPIEGNQLIDNNGLYVAKQHKLTFGPYEYDGTKDVTVTVYDGEYNEI